MDNVTTTVDLLVCGMIMKIAEKNDTLADVITHSKVDNCWSKDEGIGEMQKTGAVPVQ